MNFGFIFLVLYLSIFGGAIGVFAKFALQAFSPITIIFFRALISIIFFLIIFIYQKRLHLVLSLVLHNIVKFFVLALSGVLAAMVVGFFGLHYTSAINYGLIYNMSSIFILIFSVLFLHEKLRISDLFFVTLAFIGAGIIATDGTFKFDFASSNFFGDVLVLISAIGWALYSVLGASFTRRDSSLDSSVLNFGTFLIALVILLPLVFLTPSYGIDATSVGVSSVLGLLGLAILSTAVLFFLWLRFVDQEGGIWATLVSLSENLSGVALPIIFLGENLSLPVALGGILMIFSICGKELFDKYRPS